MTMWHRAVAVLLGGLMFLGCAVATLAQLEKVRFERVEADLSHKSVYSITQDRQGFLWIGTADGLNRYNGYETIVYRFDPTDPGSLSNSVIHALLGDRAGSLWVGTENGLNRFNPIRNRFDRYPLRPPEEAEISPGVVHTILQSRDGTVWVGASDGLYRFDESRDCFTRFQTRKEADDLPGLRDVRSIAVDREGALWVLADDVQEGQPQLVRIESQSSQAERYRLSRSWGYLFALHIDQSGSLWVDAAAPGTLDVEERWFRPPPGLARFPASWAIEEGRDGTLWFGTEEGIYRSDPSVDTRTHHLPEPSAGAWLSNFVRALFEDRSGTLWVGTHGGLYRYDPNAKPFTHLTHEPANPESLSSYTVSSVVEVPPGVVWVGTYGGGLNRWDRSTRKVARFRHRPGDYSSLCDDIVWALHADPQGVLWIGSDSGLCSLDNQSDRFTRHELPFPVSTPSKDLTRVVCISDDPQGRLWLGTYTGLYRFDPATGQGYHYPHTGDGSGPSSSYIWSLELDGADTLWIGTDGKYLDRLDLTRNVFTHYPLETGLGGALSEGIWDLYRDASGSIWLATGAGLSRFDPGIEVFEHFADREDLPGSAVYSILEDDRHQLWLATNNGLARFDPAADPDESVRRFEPADGIGSREFNRHAAFRGERGDFFFGGMNGLTVFSPTEIRDNPSVPPVVLDGIEVSSSDGVKAINPNGMEKLVLSHRESTVSFEFVALSFTNPAKNRYSYRLEGLEESWVDAGARRFARYTHVPPGDYRFQVRGSNDDGIWNKDGVVLPVTILPAFWQTWWFRGLLVALVAALLTLAYRYRVARLLELERLRLRIASDLHDDLSSDLSGVAVVAEMMQSGSHLQSRDRQQLEEIRTSSLKMVDALRDIVWYIDPVQDNLEAMVQRMRSFAGRLLAGMDYRFEGSLPSAAVELDMGLRRNVFLIYKELLHNIVRHAEAQQVSIRLSQNKDSLELSVNDNGAGFDPAATYDGSGLRSIRSRAERIGGELRIDSQGGSGTTVSLIVRMTRSRHGHPKRVRDSLEQEP